MAVNIRRRRWPFVLGGIVLLIVVLLLVWDWNWFTPIVESVASARLHRQVRIGHMYVRLARAPRIELDDLRVSDPPDDPAHGNLVRVDKFIIRIDAIKLINGAIVVPELAFDHPVIELHTYDRDKKNYALTTGGTTTSSAPPQIGELTVSNGDVHFADPTLKADFRLAVNTGARTSAGDGTIRVDAKGTYAAQPIVGYFIGGSVLTLRDETHPYPIDLDLRNGDTHVSMKGSVKDPLKFAGADVKLLLEGDDLGNLYPLTGVPIPPTPKYRLAGNLDVAGRLIRFKNFTGTVGESDLEGTFDVAPGKEKPLVTADLTSRRVVLADLAGFIGKPPGGEHEAAATPQQRAVKQHEEATAPLLPTTPINLPKVRAADVKLHYVGKRIESRSTPLDNLDVRLDVENGVIKVRPLKFGVGTGNLALDLALDGRENEVHAAGDLRVQHIDLQRIMQDLKPFKGQGIVGGHANITTRGNSLAAMMANGNGEMVVNMTNGNLSALLTDLAGLEIGRAIYRYVLANEQTPVRCLVADVVLDRGILKTKTFVLDTGEENLYLGGTVDFRTQALDLKLSSQAKHFSILSVKAPVDITGSIKDPSIMPDKKALAERGIPAAVLGTLLTPVASLVATLQLGDNENVACKALEDQAHMVQAKQEHAPPPERRATAQTGTKAR